MEEVINICLDLSFLDKEFIIRKYLLKYLKDGVLEKLDCGLITDIFNILNLEEVEQFHNQIENIIGEFDNEEFLEIKWKIGKCFNCSKFGHLYKCKKEHAEDCTYGEITDPEGCNNLFCDDCIFHRCDDNDEDCLAVRCESCSTI